MSTTMTIRLHDEVKAGLERIAATTRRSASLLAAEAIQEFVRLRDWQIAEGEALAA